MGEESGFMMFTRNIGEDDGMILYELAKKNKPLDVHTPYTYWVIAKYFGNTSFLMFDDGRPIGYITSVYNGQKLLIWQICVSEEYRGKNYAQSLIDLVFEQALNLELSVEVAISDDNGTSKAAFEKYCKEHDLKMNKNGTVKFQSPESAEIIYRINPSR